MLARTRIATAALPLLALLAACSSDDDNGTGTGTTAQVQFVNATGSPINVLTNGASATGNSNVAYGTAGSCMNVNASNPGLTFQNSSSSSNISASTAFFA